MKMQLRIITKSRFASLGPCPAAPPGSQQAEASQTGGEVQRRFLLIISFLPQITQLNALISLLIGNLTAGDRMKIMTICTIDVHARDVVAKMIVAKVEVTPWCFHCLLSWHF